MVDQLDFSDILGTKETEEAIGQTIDVSDIIGDASPGFVPEFDTQGNEFTRAIERGWNNIQALSGDAIEAYGEFFDLPDAIAYGKGVAAKNRLEAAQVGAPSVPSFKALQEDFTYKNLGDFTAKTIGESLPSFVPSIGGATAFNFLSNFVPYLRALKYGKIAATALGAYIPSQILGTGEAAAEQKRLAGTDDIPDASQAIMTGIKTGAFDVVTLIPILRAFKAKGGTIKSPKEIEEVFDVKSSVAIRAAKAVPGILVTTGATGVIEGVTEAAQEAEFMKDAEKVTGVDIPDEEFQERLIESLVQGSIGGGTIGFTAGTVGSVLPNRTGDTGLKLNDVQEGTVIKYSSFREFQNEQKRNPDLYREEQEKIKKNYGLIYPNGINNQKDFLRLRNAEVNQIVDKPARAPLQEIYDKGGRPTAVNYYGRGEEFIKYNVLNKKTGELESRYEPLDVGRFTRYKKNIKNVGSALRDVTIGKSVSLLDDLAKRSPTAKRLRGYFSYFDDGTGKDRVQGADISESILLNMGKYSNNFQKGLDIISRGFRVPGLMAKISPKTNRLLYQALNDPKANVPPRIRRGAELMRKDFDGLYKYTTEAEFIDGMSYKGSKNVGFTPGFIENYFPIILQHKRLQNDSRYRKQFRELLASKGFKDPDKTIQQVIDDKGIINLSTADMPTRKAGAIEEPRTLKNLTAEELAPFTNTNVIDVFQKYRDGVIRRVEYGKRFGKENELRDVMFAKIEEEANAKGLPLTKKEKERMVNIGQALQKQYKPIENNFLRKLNAGLITYGYVLTLPFATISSLSEPFLVLSRGGTGPKIIAKSVVSGMKGIVRSVFPRFPRDEFDRAVADIGLGLEAAVIERQSDAFGGGQDTNKFTEKFFRFNFLSQFTRWNRMLANASGRNMVFSNAGFLSDNMERRRLTSVDQLPNTGRFKLYQEQLRELGVNPQDAVDFVRSDMYRKKRINPETNDYAYKDTDFYQNQVRLAGVRYVNEVVMNPRATTRPMWMSDPKLAIFAQLKGFQVAFSNTVLKRWYKEIFQTGFYNGVANGAKYAAVGSVMVVAASLGNELREAAKFGPNGNPRYKDETDIERLKRALERTGLLGPLQFLIDAARAEQYGSGPVEALMGPIVTRLVSYLEGIADALTKDDKKKIIRELIKSVPIISANVGGARDKVYEALGVESTFGQGEGLDFSVDSFSLED
tara:strand:+ start:3061 stop:6645 length:3585 start_codon:yes stop_codon:yes gene_type:complete